jgi:hypothetical protein
MMPNALWLSGEVALQTSQPGFLHVDILYEFLPKKTNNSYSLRSNS